MTNLGTRTYLEAKDPVRNFMSQALKGGKSSTRTKWPSTDCCARRCALGVEVNCEWAIDIRR